MIWLAAVMVDAWQGLRPSWRRALVGLTLATLLLPYWVVGHGNRDAISRAIYPSSGYTSQAAVANYLRTHAPENEPIYVAFDQASIYYLADRPTAYRHMYDQELQAIPTAEDDLVAMIAPPTRPAYIVATGESGPFDDDGVAFWTAVGQHYHLETVVSGLVIFRANAPLTG